MVDTSLMFTLAQVSATFVAIISGFYTSKIISISSEKQRIRNKIAEIDAELKQRNKIAQIYQGRLNEIFGNRAKQTLVEFTGELLASDELKEYSLEELNLRFKELMGDEPDEYEKAAISQELQQVTKRIKEELEIRTPKKMTADMPLSIAAIAFNPLTEKMRRESNKVRRLYSTSAIENGAIDEAVKGRDDEHKPMAILSTLKAHHEQELKSITLPKNITFGYISQVIFAIFGVAIPLGLATWPDRASADADRIALIWFGLGLSTVFVYILSEVRTALRGERAGPNAEPTQTEELASSK